MAASQNLVMHGLKQHNSQISQGFIYNPPSSRSRWSQELCRNHIFTTVSARCSSDRELQLTMVVVVNNDTDCTAEDSSASLCENGVREKELSISTILVNFNNSFDPYGALSTPLYQTATFKQPSATENGPYDYTRSGNPTRDSLEDLLAKLDGVDRAFCFTSGMAALSVVTHLVEAGQEIVVGDDIYGGSDRFLSRVVPKYGYAALGITPGC
jgi:cystathionine beta-lyase